MRNTLPIITLIITLDNSILNVFYFLFQMLPIITLIFINCLLDVTSTPVYNMQPAHITANIGKYPFINIICKSLYLMLYSQLKVCMM